MRCCLCGKEFDEYDFGNSIWPLKPMFKDAGTECCDSCNLDKVLPERLRLLERRHDG